MFAVDKSPTAYYFDPASIKIFEDKVIYTARFPLRSVNANGSEGSLGAAYQDVTTILDCKKSTSALLERTAYDKTGAVIANLKRSDPDLSDAVPPGTIIFIAEQGLCNGRLEVPVVSKDQLAKMSFKYLSTTTNGDGDLYYALTETKSDALYRNGAIFIAKSYGDHKFADLFPGQNVLGLPSSYRTFAETVQLDCKQKRVLIEKDDYFDQENNWVNVSVPTHLQPIDAPTGSNFALLLKVSCGVTGTYEGTTNTSYKNGALSEQKMSMIVEQNGSDINVSYRTAAGGEGKGVGKLNGASVKSISLESTTPGCPGSYEASLDFSSDTVSWSFKGEDCGGPMEGHGTGKRNSG
jgi:hypothetical protein